MAALTIAELKASLALPVFAAPMFLISGPDLVVEACRAGIVGSFPASNCRTLESFDSWLREITGRVETLRREQPGTVIAPWAVNLVLHRTNPRLEADLELVLRYRPPIVITALGSPRRIVEPVHAYGGLVFADVNSMVLARKAADCGVDGLALVASGAGGHTGTISPFAFVPSVRRWWDGAIVVGGAIGDAAAIRAAETLGADFAYLGTRFIATPESLADPVHKQMIVEGTMDDLIVSNAFTGAYASWLKPSIVRAGHDLESLQPRKNYQFKGQLGDDPKPWKGIFSAGQGIDLIDRQQSVAEIVAALKLDYTRLAGR